MATTAASARGTNETNNGALVCPAAIVPRAVATTLTQERLRSAVTEANARFTCSPRNVYMALRVKAAGDISLLEDFNHKVRA